MTLAVRYAATGLISLAGTTALLRLTDPALWAPYAVAYFLVAFVEREAAGRLLGSLIAPGLDAGRDLEDAGARAMALLAAAVVGVMAPVAVLVGGPFGVALGGAAVALAVLATRAVAMVQLERTLRYRRVVAVEVLDQLTFFAVALPLCAADPRIEWLALALALRGLPGAVWLQRGRTAPLLGRSRPAELHRLLTYAAPGAGSTACVLVEGLVPLMVLSSRTELGLAMTAASIASYPAVVHTIAQRLTFPAMSRLHESGRQIAAVAQRATGLSLLLIVATMVPVVGLAPTWLEPLLGEDWRDAAAPLGYIGVGYVAAVVLSVGSGALLALRCPRDVFAVLVLATAAYLAAGFFVEDDATHVAAAYLGSRLLGGTVALIALRRRGACLRQVPVYLALLGAGVTVGALQIASGRGDWKAVALILIVAAALWFVPARGQLSLLRTRT
jgi:O-antigen/teichoic acid export membrane protein